MLIFKSGIDFLILILIHTFVFCMNGKCFQQYLPWFLHSGKVCFHIGNCPIFALICFTFSMEQCVLHIALFLETSQVKMKLNCVFSKVDEYGFERPGLRNFICCGFVFSFSVFALIFRWLWLQGLWGLYVKVYGNFSKAGYKVEFNPYPAKLTWWGNHETICKKRSSCTV